MAEWWDTITVYTPGGLVVYFYAVEAYLRHPLAMDLVVLIALQVINLVVVLPYLLSPINETREALSKTADAYADLKREFVAVTITPLLDIFAKILRRTRNE